MRVTHLCPLLQALVELVDPVVRLAHVRRVAPVKLGKRRRVERVGIHIDHLYAVQETDRSLGGVRVTTSLTGGQLIQHICTRLWELKVHHLVGHNHSLQHINPILALSLEIRFFLFEKYLLLSSHVKSTQFIST